MSADALLSEFTAIATSAGGVDALRQFVLQLAVTGRLVPQVPGEEPALELARRLPSLREALIDDGQVRRPRHPQGIPVEDPPYDVPPGWTWLRLGDVGAIVGGGTPRSKEPRFWATANGIPWLTPADMSSQETRYVSRGRRDITDEGLRGSSAQLLPAGSVLFSSRAPIGYVGIAAQPLSTNQGFKSCVPYESAMAEYLWLFLKKVGREVHAEATGTTFKEVSGKEVALIPIPVPPLAEQSRIVERAHELVGLFARLEELQAREEVLGSQLSSALLDELVGALEAEDLRHAWSQVTDQWHLITSSEEGMSALESAIADLAVRGRLTCPDPADEPALAVLDRISAERDRLIGVKAVRRRKVQPHVLEADAPFALPAGWEWCRLDHLIYTLGDGPHYSPEYVSSEAGVPFLSTRNISSRGFRLDDLKYVSPEDHAQFSRRIKPEPGDILYTKGGTTGVALVNTLEFDFSVWVHVAVLRVAKEHVDPNYVALALNSPHCYRQSQQLTHGTGNRDLGLTRMVKITLPLPPRAEQARIVASAGQLLGLCQELRDRVACASATAVDMASSLTTLA